MSNHAKRPHDETDNTTTTRVESPLVHDGKVIVVVDWCAGRADVNTFHSEASFRQWAKQSPGDVEGMARSFRRVEAVMDAKRLTRARPRTMSSSEHHFLQGLLRAARNYELCCGDAEERWLAWYQQQAGAARLPSRFWDSFRMLEDGVLMLERLTDAATPLDTVMHDLQQLTYLSEGRALEFVVSRHPNAEEIARLSPVE